MTDSVKILSVRAFYACHSLINIRLSNNISRIEEYALAECDSLKKLKLPDNVDYVENRAILNCKSLQEIVMPDKVFYFGFDNLFVLDFNVQEIGKMEIIFQGTKYLLSYDEENGYNRDYYQLKHLINEMNKLNE